MRPTDQQISDKVNDILTYYRVNNVWAASGRGKVMYSVYAGYHEGTPGSGRVDRITEPAPHAEAQQMRRDLIAADIIEYITEVLDDTVSSTR